MDDLDISELATLLQLTPEKVQKMASRGSIPGRRIGGKWRFSKAEIHHWLEVQIGSSDGEELNRFDRVLDSRRDTTAKISIAELCPVSHITVPFAARTRSSVIRSMADSAAESGLLWDATLMAAAVETREAMHPTALECGVALLHPRRPQSSILADSIVTLGIRPAAIPFSDDGQLVDVFFLICSYDDPTHLRILSKLTRLITQTTLLQDLRSSTDADSAHQSIVSAENAVELKASQGSS